MESLTYSKIVEANTENLSRTIERALCDLETAQRTYPNSILMAVDSGFVDEQIVKTETEICADALSKPSATSAAAYFANENVIGGSMVNVSVENVNALGEALIPSWKSDRIKKKLGPGVGYTLPPSIYQKLLTQGIQNPDYSLNYTAPFGNKEARVGIKKLMNARIDPEKDFYPESGVFLTDGATEGIDLFMDAVGRICPGAKVTTLGLSYYTAPFSAEQKGLVVDRLITNPVNTTGEAKFLPTSSEVAAFLPKDTKAIILTLPGNPNGETYSDSEMKRVLELTRDRNCYILFDAIFENMSFTPEFNFRSRFLQIATEVGALKNVVVVDSLSKTKNIPGERIGFMATTDTAMADKLMNITMARRCNPRLTLGPVVLFEGIARSVKALQANDPKASLTSIVDFAMQDNGYFKRDQFLPMFKEWDSWNNQVLTYYKGNLEIVRALLSPSIAGWSPDSAAYNTLVRLKGLAPGTNNMDYLAKLMYTTATYTQVGPCFGLSQKTWDESLGVWARITYACGRKDLVEALKRLITFSTVYADKDLGNPKKFSVLNLSYDAQI